LSGHNQSEITSGKGLHKSSATTSEEIKFAGHSKNYCICIIDIVNSTQVIAKMTNSTDIRKYYSIFINTSTTIAKKFGARIIKNVGDSMVYYFPDTDDSSNELAFGNALLCCSSLNAANSVISDKLHEESLPPMLYRISADYGKVEIAKTKTSQDYDLFGSTVNLCAKINKLSAPDKVLIGGDLFRIIKSLPSISNEYNFRAAGEYSVGVKNSYPLYTVTAKSYKPVIQSFKQIAELKSLQNDPLHSVIENFRQKTKRLERVMIVDDDKDVLYAFRTILTSQGLLVDSYHDPQEALRHFRQADHDYYDLIILDIRMPELNGLELYGMLKTIDRNIKVLFVSALDASQELISMLPGIEPENILQKPLETSHLVSAVKRNLSIGRM
jgi:two-component system, OmpR family, response regulator ChvI